MREAARTAIQVLCGVLFALYLDDAIAEYISTEGGSSWLSGILSALLSALLVAAIVNFVFARPSITVQWTEFRDSAPLSKLDVRFRSDQLVSDHFRVNIVVRVHSLIAAAIVWRLRRNGTVLTISFPNGGARPAVEDPLCDEHERPLCKSHHESVDFELRRDSAPNPHWTNGTISFSPRSRVGDQTSDVHTHLRNAKSVASRYAKIVIIDTEVRSIRVREP